MYQAQILTRMQQSVGVIKISEQNWPYPKSTFLNHCLKCRVLDEPDDYIVPKLGHKPTLINDETQELVRRVNSFKRKLYFNYK